METMHTIQQRRAVRQYTGDAVDRAIVQRLIGAAVLAPSAMNLQPWAFAVLLNRQRIAGYAGRIKEWLLANFDQSRFDPALRKVIESEDYSVFHQAPALVLILAKSAQAQAAEDCCLAAQNLLLAAREEGLGTCWIGLARPWLNLPSTKKEFGIPAAYEVVAPIVLGHPSAWPESHGRNPAEILWLE